MTELLWIISVVLLFGVQIGLTMKISYLSQKNTTSLTLGLLGVLILLTIPINAYADQTLGWINEYSPFLGIILAAILLYTGFRTLKESKTSLDRLKAPVAAIILSAPLLLTSTLVGGYYTILLFLGLITLTYHGLSRLTRKQAPQVILGNIMILAGFYFLISSLVIPNINQVSSEEMNPLVIPDLWIFIYALLALFILILAGFYLTRRISPLLNQKK